LPKGLTVAAMSLFLALPAAAQSLGSFDAAGTSAEIANLLAQRNIDGAAEAAAQLMPGTTVEKLKDAFQLARGFGQSQYSDLIYARNYGRTEKDLIYKIDYDKAFMYVRFLYHVDNGAWRLIHIYLKTENDLPFPKEWGHIYPQ
jgi:hypothetical protein